MKYYEDFLGAHSRCEVFEGNGVKRTPFWLVWFGFKPFREKFVRYWASAKISPYGSYYEYYDDEWRN